ncbi:histidine phosphatase family protein [Halopseudomonas pertucinogena]|uniref:Histidine phosphatase family protein n=1 Tax=Halopseudomonas pertucinogena TaxID=86175 RepID=A0ABQ2CU18_9GAMM|nr:histidine phosphatase family protein [Halopseudomonas pertucinogena]GGJ09165.1 histidine phosphatase family protein [Halopseudomonas pertucinogena]
MSEIYFVRHGQASFGTGNYDQLSELGHEQAWLLGEYFREREIRFDHIITGDMVRHRETAEGICVGMGLEAQQFEVYPELNEFDFHSVLRAYTTQFPDQALPEKPVAADFFRRLKKGILLWSAGELQGELPETWASFEQRLAAFRESVMQRHSGQRVLAVSSGGAIAMLIRQLLQAPESVMVELNLQTRNTAVTHCRFNSRAMRLSSFNNVPHLDRRDREAMITYT